MTAGTGIASPVRNQGRRVTMGVQKLAQGAILISFALGTGAMWPRLVAHAQSETFVCDDSTDNAQALRDAIDALPDSGGTITLPAGKCVIASTVEFSQKEVTIAGEGRFATQLKFTSSTFNATMLRAVEADRLTLRHLSMFVNINNTAQTALELKTVMEFTMFDVIVYSATSHSGIGIFAHSKLTTGAEGSYSANIYASQVEGFYYGVFLGATGEQWGAHVWNLNGLKFTSNQYGLYAERAVPVNVTASRFEANAGAGLAASSDGSGAIVNNFTVMTTYFESNGPSTARKNIILTARCDRWRLAWNTYINGTNDTSASTNFSELN
jgi:hypothetical protein